MRATGMVTTVVGLALLLAAMPDAGGVSITEKGGSAYVIVVADNAPETVAAGAEELQTYLERISGARLAIVKEREHDGGLGLYLGATKRAEAAGVAIEQGRYPVRERYVIRSVDDDLLLLGNDAWRFHGTCCAVYDLLHQLGCRWYMPGAKGEIVPETPTISLEALNVDESPDFIERSGVWYEYHSENPKQDHAELEQWRRRNRMGERWLPCGHNLARLMPVDPYFKEHPEWFPLINGERRDKGAGGGLWHPCVGNEAFRAFIAERLVEQFAADPAMRAGSLGLNDATWEGWCRCEACGKMGATKDGYRNNHFTKRYLRFVDDVARRVDEKAPGRLIAATAYASTQVPPTDMAPLNDNVFVVVMHYYWSDQCKPLCDDPFYKGVFEGFAELAPDRLGVYQYYGDFHYDQLPTPAWAFLRDEFDFYRETGVRMMTIEGGNQWAANGLTYYVNARMAWDSDLDPNAVRRRVLRQLLRARREADAGVLRPAGGGIPPRREVRARIRARSPMRNTLTGSIRRWKRQQGLHRRGHTASAWLSTNATSTM